jgi:translation initiation factor 1
MSEKKGRLVYSTGPGGASHPGPERSAAPVRSQPAAAQQPRVRRETAGRGGKTVTTAGPFALTREDAAALLGHFKRLCGSGGTLRETAFPDGSAGFSLEIQGDHADRIVAELNAAGYRAKRAGG